jgi:hypothetical protein
MESYTITISNKRIFEYYQTHPHVSIESMNLVLLDLIENISDDMTKLVQDTVLGDILREVKDINYKVLTSLVQTQKESCDEIARHLKTNVATMQSTIKEDMLQLLHAKSTSNVADYFSKFDEKISIMQQPLLALLATQHDNVSSKITSIKDDFVTSKNTNDKLLTEMTDFLSRYRTSSQFKGQCSENMLESVLNRLYPTATVQNTTATKASGDFLLKREAFDDIILENKNYERNVDDAETEKFIRDCVERKTHGIMISQHSGISKKPNGFIEINSGKVLLYLHSVEYSPDKIKMAIDVIDHLAARLHELDPDDDNDYTVSKDVMDRINYQYKAFLKQKEAFATNLKEQHKQSMLYLDQLTIPDLAIYLNERYASVHNIGVECPVCKKTFSDKRSLAGHVKLHKNKV